MKSIAGRSLVVHTACGGSFRPRGRRYIPLTVVASIRVSRLLSLAAIGAVAAVWAGSGVARSDQPPQAVLTEATGDLHVANSREGQAIFQASGLAPGGSVSGTVRLVNTGTLPGDLTLQQL